MRTYLRIYVDGHKVRSVGGDNVHWIEDNLKAWYEDREYLKLGEIAGLNLLKGETRHMVEIHKIRKSRVNSHRRKIVWGYLFEVKACKPTGLRTHFGTSETQLSIIHLSPSPGANYMSFLMHTALQAAIPADAPNYVLGRVPTT